MNQTKRTAKLRNIRLALAEKFKQQGARPDRIGPAVEATIDRLLHVPAAQLRRFASLAGA